MEAGTVREEELPGLERTMAEPCRQQDPTLIRQLRGSKFSHGNGLVVHRSLGEGKEAD